MVLQAIKEAGLFRSRKMSYFHVRTISYLGKMSSDFKKVEVVRDWETPRCVKDVQSLLGFANFH